MDNSGIVQKISFTGRVLSEKLIALKPMLLPWLPWQHLVQYLCGKLLFFSFGSKSKGKVLGADRSSVYDVRSTQSFVHWEGGGWAKSPHPLVRNKGKVECI